MTESPSGTYTYSTTVNRPGAITINVIKYTSGGVLLEYYSNPAMTGASQTNSREPTINFNWGTGNIFGGVFDNVGIKVILNFKIYYRCILN